MLKEELILFYMNIRGGIKYASKNWRSPKVIVTFYLSLFCIQLPLIEGWTACYDKIFFMCLTPFLLILSKNIKLGGFYVCLIYFSTILISLLFSDGEHSIISIAYTLIFLFTFSYFYSLVYNGAFSYEYFAAYLKNMLILCSLMIPLQQLCAIASINIPFLNCHGFRWGWKFASLSIEPSSAARLFLVYFLAYIKLLALKDKRALSFQYIWKNERFLFCILSYAMLTMGSTTAIIAYGVIIIYIIMHTKSEYMVILVAMVAIILPLVTSFESVSRALKIIEVLPSLDKQKIFMADTSGAARINNYLDFIYNFDLSKSDFWFGQGSNPEINYGGVIPIYGFLGFIAQLLILYKVGLQKIFSIEFFIFIFFLGMTIGNVAYVWTCIMIWTILKYFSGQDIKIQ